MTAAPESGLSGSVLRGLKPFQRRTAEHAFKRLYADGGIRKFLVADEAGLGKTLVATGVVAKVIDHLRGKNPPPRVDVIYICSNQAIARQNIDRIKSRLGIETRALAERITLLPHRLGSLDARVNLIAFTPGTSFGSARAEGVIEERVVLYRMLQHIWGPIEPGAGPVFKGWVSSVKRFYDVEGWTPRHEIDQGILDRFADSVGGRGSRLYCEFQALRVLLSGKPTWPQINRRRRFITELRLMLAHACLDALEPDLVILDEFQRFRSLLDQRTSSGELAARLFEYEDSHTQSRALLLSATPYKLYTLSGEGGEDHYSDFIRTVEFLEGSGEGRVALESQLGRFRQMLPAAIASGRDSEEMNHLIDLRRQIQARLQKVIARTERRGRQSGGDPMLEIVAMPAELSATDVRAFLEGRKLARMLGAPAVTEYWKSAPYLLSFMDRYRLTQSLAEQIDDGNRQAALAEATTGDGLQIPRDQILNRAVVDGGNGRMRALLGSLSESGLHKTLWLPPSLPSYPLGEAFEKARPATKFLMFSSWRMAPRAVAVMASYDAERRYIPEPLPAAGFVGNRLAVTESANSLFALVTPSHSLAEVGDSLRHRPKDATALVEAAAKEIGPRVAELTENAPSEGQPQEIWYAVAPLLLDGASPDSVDWMVGPPATGPDSGRGDPAAWTSLLSRVREGLRNPAGMGHPPPDLVRVLALLAAGSPANATLRSLARIGGDRLSDPDLKRAAMEAGWAFRSLFRAPTSAGLIDREFVPSVALSKSDYWRRVLAYCLAGGLNDVLDEYFHVVGEAGGFGRSPESLVQSLAQVVRTPTRNLGTQQWELGEDGLNRRIVYMRQHLARRFGADRVSGMNPDAVDHLDAIRAAFNSPFWPFVLGTTSIGQEGLDFHWYCHAVVHWNLPSNPVDLEQREGRVNRYHGHVIRKNVAQAVGKSALIHARCNSTAGLHVNPWDEAYRLADERFGGEEGLVPHWIFDSGDARIRRHAPILPLSREESIEPNLRRSLAVYRMVFGQPRQDDLLEFVLRESPGDRQMQLVEDLTIDLRPPR